MFNIQAVPTFCEIVKVVDPNGEISDFLATFEAIDIPTLEGFNLTNGKGAQALVERVLRRADDVVASDGEPIPSSADLLARLNSLAWVRAGILRAYFAGIERAAAGN